MLAVLVLEILIILLLNKVFIEREFKKSTS